MSLTPPSHAELAAGRCAHATSAIGDPDAWLASVPGWSLTTGDLRRQFSFPDYKATIGFVNHVAALADAEDHHPELLVGYNRCEVRWSTHSVGGISENDFVCAAKVDRLFG